MINSNIINNIKDFYKKKYNSPKDLENTFYNLTKPVWENIDNNDTMIKTSDLSLFSAVQEFLLKEVIKVHKNEKVISKKINNKINSTFNLNDLKGNLKGDYSLDNIYYLDNEKYDYYFIGDIHSDSFIFNIILNRTNFFENIFKKKKFKLIFLGDYIDRGKNHFRTVEYLLLLKYLFKDNIYLLLGNHDLGKIENEDVTLYLKKCEKEKDYFYYYLRDINKLNNTFSNSLVNLYQDFLNNLNIIAFVMNSSISLFAVHGGIPRPTVEPKENDYFHYLTSFNEFTNENVDYENIRIRDNIIWSDPSIKVLQPVIPKKRFKFYKEHFLSFKNKLGFDILIRGHQAMEDGIKPLFENTLYTVFSSGMVLKNGMNINNDTVYDFVTPKVLRYNFKKGLPLEEIDLIL